MAGPRPGSGARAKGPWCTRSMWGMAQSAGSSELTTPPIARMKSRHIPRYWRQSARVAGWIGIVAFVGRDHREDVEIRASDLDAVIQQPGVVLPDVARGQSRTENRLLAAVPDAVERALSLAVEDRVVGIVGPRVQVVVPVLIVDREDEAQLVAASASRFIPSQPPASGTGRQDVGMKVVVAPNAPAVQVDIGPADSLLGQFAKLLRSLVERDELMVLRRVVLVVVLRFRLDVREDATCGRRATR